MDRAGVEGLQLVGCCTAGGGRARCSKGGTDALRHRLALPARRLLDLDQLAVLDEHLESFSHATSISYSLI